MRTTTFASRDYAADVRGEFFVAKFFDGREATGYQAHYDDAIEQMLESGIGLDRPEFAAAGSVRKSRFAGSGISLFLIG